MAVHALNEAFVLLSKDHIYVKSVISGPFGVRKWVFLGASQSLPSYPNSSPNLAFFSFSALKPAWYDSIQKDTGELIYVDAGKDETITAVEDGQSLSEKNNRKKGRKFSPLQRRTKDNHSNGKTESGSQLNGKVSCKLTKDVVLHVNDRSRDDNGPLLQRLFGIVTGHVGVDIFGRTIPDQQGDGQISRDDNRVAVHALLPDGSAVATGDILIGTVHPKPFVELGTFS